MRSWPSNPEERASQAEGTAWAERRGPEREDIGPLRELLGLQYGWSAMGTEGEASSSPWNPTPAPVSRPSLLLPIPAIVIIAVGIYLLLLGLVLLTRHCLLTQRCCTDCSPPCRKQGASRPQDCCWTCAEACDFPLPSPAHYLDACCPQPTEADWAPCCPRCCPLCDCACACQLPDCQSLNCLCFEIKLR
ncbi:keratin-associated protein 10-2 isoform X2 [Phacochoerus africanus]|uniref:keratin-associated protein 10-2 isoform X2 n=1 Tax=Phacochoerus africanus TaxID=41426 RepID=UPI001FD99C0A|nr:keratin-associated protein 10-2 isoform X2 [Phacochoerus africanus]